ncbi:MAG TPA: THUMP domain-containing protein, partial [Burkholderiales bacterium]|nr:THUMP domain-containing protein [Burkholderiales bacterium]
LTTLGAAEVKGTEGGVGFSGDRLLCWRVNLESRVASRVLWQVAVAPYRSDADVYAAARAVRWTAWFDVSRTLRVGVAAIKSPVKSLDFVTLRIKDAICDAFREASGGRPDVDTHAPDVRIHAFLTARDIALYIDTSGEPLFKRGYRKEGGSAPLRENLAAGILRLAQWTPDRPLLDPMCGSGTFLCEAAMIALDMAPGLNRRFGFEKLAGHDATAWQALRDEARGRIATSAMPALYGSDRYGDVLKLARVNLAALGVAHLVQLKQANVLEVPAPAASGVLVTNPPYGVRLSEQEEMAALYPLLGNALKKKFSGWTAYILSADMRLPKLIGLKATRRTPLFNGALECRLFEYRLVAGTMRRNSEHAPR